MRPVTLIPIRFLIPAIMLGLVSCFGPDNTPPVIEAIVLDPPGNYTPGSDIEVTAVVSDREGDPVTFLWESEGGIIHQPLEESATWELFTGAEPLSYEEIFLTVSDGKESTTRSKSIQVSRGLLVTGFTYYEGTSIPVPGVEVRIGKFTTLSDETGFYAINHLKEGPETIVATREGFDLFEEEIYVDYLKSIHHIHMSSPTLTSQLSGTIGTNDGVSFGGLKVVLLNSDWTESQLYTFTNDQGEYEIPGIPQGSRFLMVRSEDPASHFLDDSLVFQVNLTRPDESLDTRIKTLRTLFFDTHLSGTELWDLNGDTTDGFYLLAKGSRMHLQEPVWIPEDAEDAMVYLRSFVVGGCDMIGKLPSHRIWISDAAGKYLGGISWGGEGTNYPAEVSWYPSSSPTFLNLYGKEISLQLELYEGSDCVPNPFWRIYDIGLSYYH